ncbi:MAG TPA: efflux RND transporter periplasmic adaptor subunit [Stellaceae bacterium]|nr:efflux RND transporter periplasmic adaptor subunit [Stellaceae bacterium]
MTRRSIIAATAGLALASLLSATAAHAQSEPSVLVQTTALRKGSLPRVVTAYGRVEASAAARRMIMAPVAAVVDSVAVRQGEEVTKGTALLRLIPGPRTAAAYAQAQSALRVAKELVERTRKMVAQHLATGQQLAEAEKSEADAGAALASLDAEGAGGPNLIRAPFRAIVTRIAASPGAIVAEGADLLDLARPEGLVLKVGVIPAQAAAITPGDPATVTPIGTPRSFSGKVLLRGSVVEAGDGLVPVEITLPFHSFLPGEMAGAGITTGQAEGYVVPHQAILVDDRGKPYVVQAVNRVARKVPVRVLGAAGDQDVIEGRLNPSAPLVLAGNYQLVDGMKVRLADPNAKPAP